MRTAFYVSDGTAITAEVFGHALLSLFPVNFEHVTIPFVESAEKAEQVKKRVNDIYASTGERPLIFHTFVDHSLREIIQQCDGLHYDFLGQFSSAIEHELGIKAVPKTHRTHSIHETTYNHRIDAVNYAMANDDGSNLKDYATADIILVGVSRSGKTPTSLYLALQYGIKAANYPFTDDDNMDDLKLPKALVNFKSKLFGLTIDPERLSLIRNERRANSKYASLRQCRHELAEVEALYQRERIPYINSTHFSIEEISAKIIDIAGLKRNKY